MESSSTNGTIDDRTVIGSSSSSRSVITAGPSATPDEKSFILRSNGTPRIIFTNDVLNYAGVDHHQISIQRQTRSETAIIRSSLRACLGILSLKEK
jgi:hypothetical protein